MRLFSVGPHAMSVERVFSTMGWINSARRGSMTTKNLEMATKVYLSYRTPSKQSFISTDFSMENLNVPSDMNSNSEDMVKDFGDDNDIQGKKFFKMFCKNVNLLYIQIFN